MVDLDRLLAGFLEIVEIDSLTFHEKPLVDLLAAKLERLGFSVRVDGSAAAIGGQSGNLIARLPGDGGIEAVFFNSHLDTVDPGSGVLPVVRDGVVYSQGDTVLGADDKAGVAALLEMAHLLAAGEKTHGPIELLFTVAEEKGLLGAKNLDWSLVDARFGFVLDAAGMVGEITTVAPWQNTISAEFYGKAAHAGVSPEAGVSAIQAAARAVETMPLGRRDRETTANIGIIEGGRAVNIVPERAIIKGEARSHKLNKLNRQTDRMLSAMERAARAYGAKVEIDVNREYDGFDLSPKDTVVQWAADAVRSIGLKPVFTATGGGSDTNIFNAQGIPTVNLGVGYKDPHTTDESISVEQLKLAAELAVALVDSVARLGRRSG